MRLLDLFCCQGGASHGYALAGFEVTGVDITAQPRYPYTFVQADALEYLAQHGAEYDVISASPPCQAWSIATPAHARERYPQLIAPTRELLVRLGKPYIIENVHGARHELRNPIMLCGTMFHLPVWRHRYFESNVSLRVPGLCQHNGRPVTIHSGSNSRKSSGGKPTDVQTMREALGCPWMSGKGLYECIPPAYTEYLGRQVMGYLREG